VKTIFLNKSIKKEQNSFRDANFSLFLSQERFYTLLKIFKNILNYFSSIWTV